MFLCVVFSLGINTSYFHFTTAAESFNNLFMLALTGSVLVVPPLIAIKLSKNLAGATEIAEAEKPVSDLLLEGGEKEPVASSSLAMDLDEYDKSCGGDTDQDSEVQGSRLM